MLKKLAYITLFFASLAGQAQEKEFTVRGNVPLPDGYSVGIVCHTDTAYSVSLADDHIKDGHFLLTGKIGQPMSGTLMTNNLELIEQNGWPIDSVHWTYTEIFLSADELEVHCVGRDEEGNPVLQMNGSEIQQDFNELQQQYGGAQGDHVWDFIDSHPQSVISVWLANHLLERAYNLTAEEVERLENTIQGNAADPQRFEKFKRQLDAYKTTVKNAPLTDLELKDVEGNTCQLVDIVPQGKYVLIDFWASWCGICLHAMPDVAKIAEDYKEAFTVVGVSIDTDEEAWHRAMKKHPEPWPQYVTTPQGYSDLFTKYQVGNGVPYYLLLSPDSKVLCSPENPEEVRLFLETNH